VTTYFDTSTPGGQGPIVASGPVFFFGQETSFWLSAASNLIPGQSTGPTVTFTVTSKKNGVQIYNLDYGDVLTPIEIGGYRVDVAVPTGGNPVSIRAVLSGDPVPVVPSIVGTATSNAQAEGTFTGNGPIATSYGTVVSALNSSNLAWTIRTLQVFGGALAGGPFTISADLVILQIAGSGAQAPVTPVWKAATASPGTHAYISCYPIAGVTADSQGNLIIVLANPIVLLPGETLALKGIVNTVTGIPGLGLYFDYEAVPQ